MWNVGWRCNSQPVTSLLATLGFCVLTPASTQAYSVSAEQKISDVAGFLSSPGSPGSDPGGLLADNDRFHSPSAMGDLDGDSIPDIAVGSPRDDAGSNDAGAFYFLLLNADGTVKERSEVSMVSGGLAAALTAASLPPLPTEGDFGFRVTHLGDLDGAGGSDFALAVSAPSDPGAGGSDRGAVYVLFMNAYPALTVQSLTKIGDGEGNFPAGELSDSDLFGFGLASLGDVDGDGVVDLAVGSPRDDDAGTNAGAVWIVFLETTGLARLAMPPVRVTNPQTIDGDRFGASVASLGLYDGDGVPDMAVGTNRRDVVGIDDGAVWIVTLSSVGVLQTASGIYDGAGGLPAGTLDAGDQFGYAMAPLDDLNGDGAVELVVGAVQDDDGATGAGAAYVFFLNPAGTGNAIAYQKISNLTGGLVGPLLASDLFGFPAAPGDIDGDGTGDLVIGSLVDDDGGLDRGAVWVLFMTGCGDGVVEPPEACDDGNTASGDTCSSRCLIEEVVFLTGTASGGTVSVTIGSEVVGVATSAGQDAAAVLANLADAANTNPNLDNVETTSNGEAFYTTGGVSARSNTDPGLTEGFRGDLTIQSSTLSVQILGIGAGPVYPIGQSLVPPGLLVAEDGSFTLPDGVFTTNFAQPLPTTTQGDRLIELAIDNDPIACGPSSGAPVAALITTPISFSLGVPGGWVGGGAVRCTGGLGGHVKHAGGFVFPPFSTVTADLDFVGRTSAHAHYSTSTTTGTLAVHAFGGAPWTAGTASVQADFTYSLVRTGFDSRRADGIGALKVATPLYIVTNGFLTNPFHLLHVYPRSAMFDMHLQFVPEPGSFMLLVTGALGLIVFNRRRSRK